MTDYFKHDQWKIIEDGFHPERNMISESVMSLGNGHMGVRGNFEEEFSGESLQGTYLAGVYYPDKTRVGWWKVGYPEYFAKVLNATNFIGIHLKINGLPLDLAECKIKDFKRILNMKEGYLQRSFTVIDKQGRETEIDVLRFLSIVDKEVAAIAYSITPLGYQAELEITPLLDGTITNQDANYDEVFWDEVERSVEPYTGLLAIKTKKTNFLVATAMKYSLTKSVNHLELNQREKYIDNRVKLTADAGEKVTLYKYIGVTTSRDYPEEEVSKQAMTRAKYAAQKGFSELFAEQAAAWKKRWKNSDIFINGDTAAQQGIRFNIFQLNQTYTGEDSRLNIGPKGFTGEKYGGSTYWDTEAYCLPFYLSTSEQEVARNLLLYRYNHLEKAKENAAKLGLKGALYPMVTMNGEESHNEWEITFEEIHRNAAIIYAIFNYVNYTGDQDYPGEYGFEVMVEVARFWADRVNYHPDRDKYMILGVTGPNEYENNVNNNWYTNRMAAWCLDFTLQTADYLKKEKANRYQFLTEKLKLNQDELERWHEISSKMYYPVDIERGIFLQQDGYLDKELISVDQLNSDDLPINQNWSWDRILRSCFIKQADVLQGLFFLNDQYDLETKKNNFDFYEPKTVHESSLSPCIYSIIAAEIGYQKKAYQLYLRTARLDLENYNNDTDDGLHITSMAGTWMSIIYGFAGMRVNQGKLSFKPFIPEEWKDYSFKILFRGRLLKLDIYHDKINITLEKGKELALLINADEYLVPENEMVTINLGKR